jgi:hypothetical protein
MLHKDYDRKGSIAKKKNSGHDPPGAWRQDGRAVHRQS